MTKETIVRFAIGFLIMPAFISLIFLVAWLIRIGGVISISVLIFLACTYCGVAVVKMFG